MVKVFVVVDWDNSDILGIYTTKKKAKESMKYQDADFSDEYAILEEKVR